MNPMTSDSTADTHCVLTYSIDKQLWRQNHKSEVEAEWRQRQAAVLEKELPSGFEFDDHMMEDIVSPRESRKDKLLAKKNPAAYCADRCLATGNCDVFEDILELSAMEVLAFCSDCVLGEGEEPCNVPEAAFDKLLP